MKTIAFSAALASLLVAALPGGAQTPAAPSAAAAPSASASAGIGPAVDAVVAKLLASKRVPGVAVAVESHGAIVYERGYGVADLAKKTPVTVDTAFEIGSVTKQFTAACILQLARAGKLSLDDHLGTYVSDYFVGRGVTIRELLGQTSGIPEYLEGDDVIQAAGSQPATYATILARVAAKPLDFPPGTKWAYSNTNYILLGRIVEVVSHEKYEAYVREHLFAPAGMTQSGFMDDEPSLPAMARGYAAGASGTAPAPPLRDAWAWSAGAIVSTVGDLIKWDDALLAGKIVAPADVALMRASGTIAGAPTHYGFGWVVDAIGEHARVWHNGGTFGFHAVNATYPSDGEAIVVLGNSTYAGIDGTASAVFTADHPDVAAATSTAVSGEDPAITARAKAWLHRFETNDIDRTQLSDSMSKALTPELLAQVATQFKAIGTPATFVFRGQMQNGPVTVYTYVFTCDAGTFKITMALDAAGKIAGYLVQPG